MQVDLEGASDAGAQGFGGYVSLAPGVGDEAVGALCAKAQKMCSRAAWKSGVQGALSTGVEFREEFSAAQQQLSRTWREAWAVLKLLQCHEGIMNNCSLRLFVDNLSLAFGLG